MEHGEWEGEKLIHTVMGIYRNEESNQARSLAKARRSRGRASTSAGAEFAMLNTLSDVGSEKLSHSARHVGGPVLKELPGWEDRHRSPVPRGQSTTGGCVRTDRRRGARLDTGTERKRWIRSTRSAQRTNCSHMKTAP